MSAQILPLRAPAQPVADFLRIGETGYLLLADLHAEGRLPARRVVVDASRLHHQKELIEAFRVDGAEIVLDTKAAELAAVAKCGGYARAAPWSAASNGEPLGPEHFSRGAPADVIGQIARFAIEHRFHAVLAPSHFLREGGMSPWFAVDRDACLRLRAALDREGGAEIAIDYPLILGHTVLNDPGTRGTVVAGLADLPFDNLWVRASGFGSDGAPATTRRFITALWGIHNLGKPVVADYLGGGLVGLASIAFGAVCGLACGIGERERFDALSWHKPPPARSDESGGRAVRIAVPGLDKSLTVAELKLLASARGGTRLVVCGDRECCRNGLDDMLRIPRRHAAYQRFVKIRDLERTPDLNRERHFLDGEMTRVDRSARQVKELKTGEEQMTKRLVDHSRRVERLRTALEHLHEMRGEDHSRSAAAVRRPAVRSQHRRGEA
jgi:hypothetical protein